MSEYSRWRERQFGMDEKDPHTILREFRQDMASKQGLDESDLSNADLVIMGLPSCLLPHRQQQQLHYQQQPKLYTVWSRHQDNRGPKVGLLAMSRFQQWLLRNGTDPSRVYVEGFPPIDQDEQDPLGGLLMAEPFYPDQLQIEQPFIEMLAACLDAEPERIAEIAEYESGGRAFGHHSLMEVRFDPQVVFNMLKPRADLHQAFTDMMVEFETADQQDNNSLDDWRMWELAAELDHDIACMALSMGVFGMRGYEHRECGYRSATHMLGGLERNLTHQGWAFLHYIMSDPERRRLVRSGLYLKKRHGKEEF